MSITVQEFVWFAHNFQRKHFTFIETLEDMEIVLLIGLHQERGGFVSMKEILALSVGSRATLERRLARLKEIGIVISTRGKVDRRVVNLRLNAKTMRGFQQFGNVLAVNAEHIGN